MPGTVLLVEDSPVDAELCLRTIRHADRTAEVIAFGDGAAALDWLAGEDQPSPDLVLLDLVLPGLDGYGILARLRDDARWRYLPAVVLTAYADEATRQRCLDLGARAVVAKPLDLAQLRTIIAAIVAFWLAAARARLLR